MLRNRNSSGMRRRKRALIEIPQSSHEDDTEEVDKSRKQSVGSEVCRPGSTDQREASLHSLAAEPDGLKALHARVSDDAISIERDAIGRISMSRSLDVNWDRRWQQESEGEITAEEEASAAAAAAVASNVSTQ